MNWACALDLLELWKISQFLRFCSLDVESFWNRWDSQKISKTIHLCGCADGVLGSCCESLVYFPSHFGLVACKEVLSCDSLSLKSVWFCGIFKIPVSWFLVVYYQIHFRVWKLATILVIV